MCPARRSGGPEGRSSQNLLWTQRTQTLHCQWWRSVYSFPPCQHRVSRRTARSKHRWLSRPATTIAGVVAETQTALIPRARTQSPCRCSPTHCQLICHSCLSAVVVTLASCPGPRPPSRKTAGRYLDDRRRQFRPFSLHSPAHRAGVPVVRDDSDREDCDRTRKRLFASSFNLKLDEDGPLAAAIISAHRLDTGRAATVLSICFWKAPSKISSTLSGMAAAYLRPANGTH